MHDWRMAADYAYTQGLSAPQWAWEFLRRNPEYRLDYQKFISVWRDLEAAYGVPPERDFPAWKADPRAYVRLGDAGSDGCRVDEDKVLIECALGAKWGFYQFPKDPELSTLELEELPVWRDVVRELPLLDVADTKYLGADASCVALGFDLSLPLGEQIAQAKLKLGALKSARRRGGQMQLRALSANQARWSVYLRALDAELAGVQLQDVAATLPEALRTICLNGGEEMRYLCRQGYREILGWPEG